MSEPEKKDLRRQKLVDKNYKKEKLSEEQKFLSKSKKDLKRKIEDIIEEELWNDWEERFK
jgi:predicted transcriptional regulator